MDPEPYVSTVFAKYGWRRPLRIRAGSRYFTLVANPEHIIAVFRAAKQAGAKPATGMALRRVLGASAKAAQYWDADDSGIATQPRKGTNVPSEFRVHYWVAHTAQEFLSGSHLQALNEKFITTLNSQLKQALETRLREESSPNSWVEYPDLYSFVQSTVGRSATTTLMGPHLLELAPDLLDDFRTYDNNLLKFLFGWPRRWAQEAYLARDRLREALKKWHAVAHEEAAASLDQVAETDPEFNEYFGSKLIRSRQSAMMRMNLDDHDRASLDLGLMFAVNSNVLRAIFWFLLHAVQDRNLQARLLSEVRKCRRPNGVFDVEALSQQPRLQSAFAEVCRFYVAIGITRTVKHSDLKLGAWVVPVGETLAIFSRTAAFSDEAWAALGHRPGRPLSVFDAERFLVPPNPDTAGASADDLVFSLEGAAGCWLPFGGGQRKCPGRHFAKSEMLGTFAMLLTKYEVELSDSTKMGDIKPNLRWYPTGTLPPKSKIWEAENSGRSLYSHVAKQTLIDETFVMICVGYDSTANTLAWFFKFMESNAEVQTELRNVLKAAFPGPELPSVQQILDVDVPYLSATCEEAIRLGGAAKAQLRQAIVNTEVLGCPIPKGA
ncbi:hypothetical protein N0V82_000952 [Gnomoniopsis sp. IMI 355080]|nr:hypothetical protein N0V82_000952 [Gnomoniopsis sp. IMI 355080]